MPKKLYPTNTLGEAQAILIAWEHIDATLKIGPLSSESLAADLEKARALQEKIYQLQTELLNARYNRDQACIAIWDQVKRVRSGIKGLYGDDSTQYEIAGGTRLSQKKKPRRSPALSPLDDHPEVTIP